MAISPNPFDAITRIAVRCYPRMSQAFGQQSNTLIIFYDDRANEIPYNTVMSQSPRTTVGNVTGGSPVPGIGYYCHYRLVRGSYGTHGATEDYELQGPNWIVNVNVLANSPQQITVHVSGSLPMSPDFFQFLSSVP
jgi:hypothetical protein